MRTSFWATKLQRKGQFSFIIYPKYPIDELWNCLKVLFPLFLFRLELSNNEFIYSETRTGNNLYQELSFQDSDALGDIDEGADITGKFILVLKIDALNIEY